MKAKECPTCSHKIKVLTSTECLKCGFPVKSYLPVNLGPPEKVLEEYSIQDDPPLERREVPMRVYLVGELRTKIKQTRKRLDEEKSIKKRVEIVGTLRDLEIELKKSLSCKRRGW